MSEETLAKVCAFVRETALLVSTEELLQWDERTYLPAAGGEYRAEQVTHLSGIVHRRRTDPRLGEWLAALSDGPLAEDPHSDAGTTIRQLHREYTKQRKIPAELVEALSRAAVLGQRTWADARKQNDFSRLRPCLEEILRLKREQAAAVGYAAAPYDALLDDFEPGETTERVASVLAQLRRELVPVIAAIGASSRAPRTEILRRHYPRSGQQSFGERAAAQIGFDFRRGRLDVTDHPFCAGLGPDDCRILTRYDEHYFPSGFYSILHEAGHGLYDQGLRREQYGLPPGSYVSLGVHESQSRLWENQVGRSRAFWEHFYAEAQRSFAALNEVALDDFWFAVNDVRPSLIRVEADEATYNLHIVIRFELEQALIDDDLTVAELPGAWNEKYQQYLGLSPADAAEGVLQDIHWSAALFGYFPTYSLGNLYAAQLFAAAEKQVGPLDEQFRDGQFQPLLKWLREQVHGQGQRYSAGELVQRICGQPLSHEPLIAYLRAKYAHLYGLT